MRYKLNDEEENSEYLLILIQYNYVHTRKLCHTRPKINELIYDHLDISEE